MVCFKQLCLFLKTSYHYIAQASLELSIYLPQPSECWHYRLVLECSICCNVFIVVKIPHKACHFHHFDVAPITVTTLCSHHCYLSPKFLQHSTQKRYPLSNNTSPFRLCESPLVYFLSYNRKFHIWNNTWVAWLLPLSSVYKVHPHCMWQETAPLGTQTLVYHSYVPLFYFFALWWWTLSCSHLWLLQQFGVLLWCPWMKKVNVFPFLPIFYVFTSLSIRAKQA